MRKLSWALCAALVLLVQPARALTFDWSTISWSDGSLSGSQVVDGVTVTVSITGDTGFFISDYPQITDDFTGGLSDPDVLDIFLNFNRDNRSITVTVTFSETVTDVNFTLFDVDTASDGNDFVDQVREIHANNGGGPDLAATVTGSANNTVSGSGTTSATVTGTASTSDTGFSSGNANATIDFGTNTVTSFTFTYGNDSSAQFNPAQQGVGFYDIQFNKVPEYHPALLAALACSLLALWKLRQGGGTPF